MTAESTDTRPSWVAEWDELVDRVGEDFSDGSIRWGGDPVESGTVRRYLEPLEIDSPIHHDENAARAAGFEGVIAPATGLLSWAIAAMRNPGEETLYGDEARDAQPTRSPINNEDPYPGPTTSGFLTASMELDFVRPVVLGERLGNRGRRLISCSPKQTSLGRGAFLSWENDIVSDRGDVVARVRNVVYAYNPVTEDSES